MALPLKLAMLIMSFRRAIAMLLPACFLWVFASCVEMCSTHSAEACNSNAALFVNSVSASPEDGCCPVTEAPASVLPERVSFIPAASRDFQVLLVWAVPANRRLCFDPDSSILLSSPDPPFERLRTLRI